MYSDPTSLTKGVTAMKKKNDSFLLGSLIAGVVSALCLQGMKLVGKKMEKDEKFTICK